MIIYLEQSFKGIIGLFYSTVINSSLWVDVIFNPKSCHLLADFSHGDQSLNGKTIEYAINEQSDKKHTSVHPIKKQGVRRESKNIEYFGK